MTIKITPQLLRAICPQASDAVIKPVAAALNVWLPIYQINTIERVACFIGQAAVESDWFTTLQERGGPSYFKRYDGRKDLGNVQPGDGARFHGRGIFQLTGRVNYAAYGKRMGVDLIADPDRAATPDMSVRIACEYWKAKGLNAWADRGDIREITRRINGGFNHLEDRERATIMARGALKKAAPTAPVEAPKPAPIQEDVPDAPIAAEPVKPMSRSSEGNTAIGMGAGGAVVAWDSGKTAIDAAHTARDTAQGAGEMAGFHGSTAVLFGVGLIIVAGAIYLWFRRRYRLQEYGV